MKRYTAFILLVILLFGAFLRFYRLKELGTFRGDQAIELSTTAQILQGKFTLIGIKTSNSQMHNGAVMYYIMAPFLYLFRLDPVAGGVVQSLLSLATVLAVYFLGKKVHNGKVALFAAFLVSASPLLVRYSRQTLLAFYPLFFTGLSLFLVELIYKKFSGRVSLLLGILLGFMLQIHYATVTVLAFAVIAPWLFLSPKLIKKYYLFLIVGFIVGLLPILVFEFRHQFFNARMFLLYLSQQKNLVSDNFNLFFFWREVIAQLLFGGNLYIAAGFMIGILLLSAYFWRKLNISEKLYILQIVLVVVFGVFFVRQMITHYAISSFVPLILLSTALLYRLKGYIRKWFSAVAIIIAVIFLFINFQSYGLTENHGWTMTKGWNLVGVEKTAQFIFSDSQFSQWRSEYNVAMLVDAENQALPLRYFLDIWGYPPLPVESYDKAKVLYVVAEPGINLEKINMWEIASFGPYDIEKKWSIQNGFTLYRLGKKSV